jgi:hypothetical protein
LVETHLKKLPFHHAPSGVERRGRSGCGPLYVGLVEPGWWGGLLGGCSREFFFYVGALRGRGLFRLSARIVRLCAGLVKLCFGLGDGLLASELRQPAQIDA